MGHRPIFDMALFFGEGTNAEIVKNVSSVYYVKVKYHLFQEGKADISAWPHRGDEDWQLSKDSADAATVEWIVKESVKKQNQDCNRASLIIDSF